MRIYLGAAIIGSAALLAGGVLADPPERVGRVAYVEGGVAMQPFQSDDWIEAFINFPVAEGEGFWTGQDGRAELQVGGVAARLDSESELDVNTLRWGDMRLALAQGSVNIQVRGSPEGGVLVATPAGDVHLEGRGFYRIDVAAPEPDGDVPAAEVTVFQGQAEAPSPEGYAPIYPGQSATLYAGYDPQFQEAEDTAIDDWSRERIRAAYIPGGHDLPEAISGGADLARWGNFVQSPEFGTVWFPRDVPPGWAPYRFGRWVDVPPWGYTWVDDAPWGFAPFHYGRWAEIDGRWAWIPGRSEAQPAYAPALVAFVGGDGWGAQFGADDAIGWIPLGPGEAYRPTYAVSDEALRRLNAADIRADEMEARLNTLDERRELAWRNARAATVARADALARGAPVRQAMVTAPPEAVLAAPRARVALPPPSRPALIAVAPNRPPPGLRGLRQAIAAPPQRFGAPPLGLASRRPPPPPGPPGAGPERLIAPAQRHNPAAQNRHSVAPPPGAEVAPPAALPPRRPNPRPGSPAAMERPPGYPTEPEARRPPLQRQPPSAPAPPPAIHAEAPPAHLPGGPTPPAAARASSSAQAEEAQAEEARARAEARREARRKAAEAAAQAAGQLPAPGPPPR